MKIPQQVKRLLWKWTRPLEPSIVQIHERDGCIVLVRDDKYIAVLPRVSRDAKLYLGDKNRIWRTNIKFRQIEK